MAHCKTGLLAGHAQILPPRRNQRGFALLLVFLMAAVIAITLYMEIPRFSMQAQRDKEETLIDRGEQYKRAIQLFVGKTRRYPAEIKDLENFNNQRFLRHRYIDPMTGKDEWRLIHVQNGILTDSKVTKPNAPGKDKDAPAAPNGFVGEQAGMGAPQNPTQGGGATSARDRRRATEGNNATMPGTGPPGGDLSGGQNAGVTPVPGEGQDTGQLPLPGTQPYPTGQPVAGQPGQPVYPPGMPIPLPGQPGFQGQQGFPVQPGFQGQQALPGQPGFQGQQALPGQPGFQGQQAFPGQQGMPGQPVMPGVTGGRNGTVPGATSNPDNSFVGGGGSFVGGGSPTGSQPYNPGQTGYPGQPTYPGQTLPGQPGAPVNSQGGGVSPYPIAPGSNGNPQGFPQPGTTTGQGNAASDMIRNILTTPRAGGMPQANPGGQTFGGGIAGVASTAEGEGVKVYNERTLYEEWEFIYDPQKQKQIPNPNGSVGVGGTPAPIVNPGQPGAPGMGPSMNPGTSPQMSPRPGR